MADEQFPIPSKDLRNTLVRAVQSAVPRAALEMLKAARLEFAYQRYDGRGSGTNEWELRVYVPSAVTASNDDNNVLKAAIKDTVNSLIPSGEEIVNVLVLVSDEPSRSAPPSITMTSQQPTSPTAALEVVVEEMKNLMVAIATRERGLKEKETGDEFLRLKKELLRYDKIVPPPDVVRKVTDAWSFWHEVSKGRGTYDERRAFIEESFTLYYANRLVSGEQVDLASFLRARDLVLGEQVGGGGFGEVFRAEHTIAGRRAVKVFRPHFYDGNREALQRFNREASILARLAHPHIVRFFDVGVAPGPRPFIITEFIDGHSLELQLKKRSMFDAREALDVCAQVLEALGSAHALGIIHRDIKPSNVMWVNGTATLLDLGSGGIMSDVITTRLTSDAQGTMGYMAPELIDDPKLLDPRTDVYSVGVLLHRLLTGRALQPGDPGHYLVQTNAPTGVLDVLRRAVAPAAQRYQTSEAMADAVREFLVSSGGTPAASSTAQRASAGSFLTKPQDILAAIGRSRSTVMPPEWLQWVRAELIGAVSTGSLRLPTRILRVVAVLTDIPQALGYDSLDWVDQDDVAHTARTVFGLVDNVAMDKLPEMVNVSLTTAIKIGLLQVAEYDAWRPGMASGSGMRDQYTVTPLGSKTLSDLGFATMPSPGPREPDF